MSVNPDDTPQWERALNGDGDAFGDLFDRHRDRLTRHCYRLVPSSEDVDDVVATTFLEAWRNRHRVRLVEDSILPWLLVTATHTAQNLRRATRRHRALLERLPRESSSVDDYEEIDGGPATESLQALALRERQLIVLCVLEGFSIDEAATALGIPSGTAKSRLFRAKRKLSHLVNSRAQMSSMTAEEAK